MFLDLILNNNNFKNVLHFEIILKINLVNLSNENIESFKSI